MRPESAKLNHSWNIFWCSLGQGPIGPDPISMRNLTVESQRSGDDWNFENLKDENRREKRILEEWDSSVLALFYNSFGALNERYIAKGICATSKVFLECKYDVVVADRFAALAVSLQTDGDWAGFLWGR